MQRLLEHVTNQEQRSLIMSALTPSAVVLSTDMNGLHVVEHCVRHFSNEDTKVLFCPSVHDFCTLFEYLNIQFGQLWKTIYNVQLIPFPVSIFALPILF